MSNKQEMHHIERKKLLQSKAYDYIKEQILEGKLVPDTLYSEARLSKELDISRTPIREALQCLSQDGYISIVPSKGFMLRHLTDKDMQETIEVRCAIEGFCTHIIAGQLSTEKGKRLLDELGRILEQMQKAKDLDDNLQTFIDSDHAFHLAIVGYAENDEFNQLFQRLLYLIHLTSATALSVTGRVDGTLEEHELYYRALREGNGNDAYQIMIRHLTMPLKLHDHSDGQ